MWWSVVVGAGRCYLAQYHIPFPDSTTILAESVSSLLDLPDRMEVIGAGDNVDMAPIVDSSALPLVVGSGTELTPPTTALTRSAFNAIAKMDEVQTQLLYVGNARISIRVLLLQTRVAHNRFAPWTSEKAPSRFWKSTFSY